MTDAEPTPIRKLPARGAKLESHGILIEWDYPKPAVAVVWHPNLDNWYKRLAPMKNTPGRRARVLKDLKDINTCRSRINNIRKSLRERDPRSHWKIEQGKQDDGLFGVWVTYNGVMTEEEYQESLARYAYNSRRAKLAIVRKQRKKQLQRSLMNPSLRPPVVKPED